MRKKDLKQTLLLSKDRVDLNLIRKYINDFLDKKGMVEAELRDVEEILNARYERYGRLTLEDNVTYLTTGNYHNLIEGVECALACVQQKIKAFNKSFLEEDFFWDEVEKNWNNLGGLIGLLLEVENFNMIVYKQELELRLQEMCVEPMKYRDRDKHVTLYGKYSDVELQRVYDYIRANTHFWAEGNADSRNFKRIFSSYSVAGIKKIRIRNHRGAKAFIRSLVKCLTGSFDAKIVNLCFCDENGNSFNLAIHDRPSKNYMEIFSNLLMNA
ncbi:hypothetical protein [Phocaeicola sp.]